MDRYFIVFYKGLKEASSEVGNAITCTVTSNGKYINQKEQLELMKNKNPDFDFIITNIIELSESDYNDYHK